jgi:hypothetical protein
MSIAKQIKEEQPATLADSIRDRLGELTVYVYNKTFVGEREAVLNELIDLHDQVLARQEQTAAQESMAQDVRQAFLLNLQDTPEVLASERFSRFLAEQIKPEDFAALSWQSPNQVLLYCQMLYGFRFETEAMAERVKHHVGHLLRHALHHFEQRGELEKMFKLLRLAPTSPEMAQGELLRLRNRVYVYEMRRIQRNRRILYVYLMLHVFLIVVLFPILFINAENGVIKDQIEAAAEVNLPEEARRFFSYTDGLYWALITAASIGYGDITPQTDIGRIIAAILGVMGVITVGITAGLILEWITPRSLD